MNFKYLFYRVLMYICWSPDLGRKYARSLGVEVEDDTIIYCVNFGSEPWLIKIGSKTWVTAGTCFVTHDGSITVVKNCPYKTKENLNRYGKIVIGDNCFIGIGCIIMPNVTIGDNSIIAAGSVVTQDVPPGSIVGGNPGRIIGTVKDFAKKVEAESLPLPSVWENQKIKRQTIRKLFFKE